VANAVCRRPASRIPAIAAGAAGTWTGGREKAPATLCRKVVTQAEGGTIEVWSDGSQTRSFLYIGVRFCISENASMRPSG